MGILFFIDNVNFILVILNLHKIDLLNTAAVNFQNSFYKLYLINNYNNKI